MDIPTNLVENKIGSYVRGTPESIPILEVSHIADSYRRDLSQQMTPLPPYDLTIWREGKGTWNIGEELYASIKVDGQFALYYFDKRESGIRSFFGSSTTHRAWFNLPVATGLENILEKCPGNVFILAGELFAAQENPPNFEARGRVAEFLHISRNPERPEELDRIGFKVFDLIQIDSENWLTQPFKNRWNQLAKMLPTTGSASLVNTEILNIKELERFYNHVIEEGHEGIVLRNSQTFRNYKVKPIHTFDAVIIGAAQGIEGSRVGPGQLASSLLAVRYPDGKYQVLAKAGGGLSDDFRRDLWNRLEFAEHQPNFVAATSDGRSFRLVKPQLIAQIQYLDIHTQDIHGMDIHQNVLTYDEDTDTWNLVGTQPFVKLIFPRFDSDHPLREDKSNSPEDVRISQVTELLDTPLSTTYEPLDLPKSNLLARYAFAKGETMVRKFLAWETNKHDIDPSYPDYAIYTLDYSAGRKANPLQRKIIVTNNASQLWQLFDQQVTKAMIGKDGSLTRGWSIHKSFDTRENGLDFDTVDSKQPAKKSPKKPAKTSKKAPKKRAKPSKKRAAAKKKATKKTQKPKSG